MASLPSDEMRSVASDGDGGGNAGVSRRGSSSSICDDREEEVRELWRLLEQKDADLRAAAQLGKMLLDEKEEDAEAHEGEKEALWRRIQEMARRVMELEQEASELREMVECQDVSSSTDPSATGSSVAGGLASPRSSDGEGMAVTMSRGGRAGVGVGGLTPSYARVSALVKPRESVAGRGSEERALRAKNEMLERQLAHMRDSAAETQLELEAARKARFGRPAFPPPGIVRSSSVRSSGLLTRSRDNSMRSMRSQALSPGSTRLGGGGRGEGLTSSCQSPSTTSTPPPALKRRSSSGLETWFTSPQAESSDEQEGEEDESSESDASEVALRTADRIHKSSLRRERSGERSQNRSSRRKEVPASSAEDVGGQEKIQQEDNEAAGGEEEEEEEEEGQERGDTAWLLEQNEWLLEQLEARDELIEELKAQLEALGGGGAGQAGVNLGQRSSHGNPSFGELGDALGRRGLESGVADSDDDSGSDDHDGYHTGFGGRERSFLDELLDGGADDAFMTADGLCQSRRRAALDAMTKADEGDGDGLLKTPERSFGGELADNALIGAAEAVKSSCAALPRNIIVDDGTGSLVKAENGKKPAQQSSPRGPGVENAPLPTSPKRQPRQLASPRSVGGGGGAPVSPAQPTPTTALEKDSGVGAVTGVTTGVPSAVDNVVVLVEGFSKNESFQARVADKTPVALETTAMAPGSETPEKVVTAPCSSEESSPPPPSNPKTESPGSTIMSGTRHALDSSSTRVTEKQQQQALVAPVATARSERISEGHSEEGVSDSGGVSDVISAAAATVATPSSKLHSVSTTLTPSPTATVTTSSSSSSMVVTSSSSPPAVPSPSVRTAVIPEDAAVSAASAAPASEPVASPTSPRPGTIASSDAHGRKCHGEPDQGESNNRIPMHTLSRAERKSRQALDKVGLRRVPGGVFRMTMKASNGVVFVVKDPDVFKHPNQNTYVVFGTAETEMPADSRPNAGGATAAFERRRSLEAAAVRAAAIAAAVPVETKSVSSRPDAALVETESVRAGLDPADVLTIVSHAGCTPDEAITALRDNNGDVVNAVMALTLHA